MDAGKTLARVQDFYLLSFCSVSSIFKRPFYTRELLAQMDYAGTGSFFIVFFVSVFIGMVLALQTSANLAPLGLKMYTGKAIGISVLREIGPVAVALAFAGRVGSGMASELGSMVLGHQVDVLRVHGVSPIKKLVTPRVLAAVVVLPVLTVIGDALSLLGGYYIAVFHAGQSGSFYWIQIRDILNLETFVLGLSKPLVFGFLITCISCYMGLSTTGGAKGLRRATTSAVVSSILMIVATDFLITRAVFYFTRSAL
jgi:phospholipid/cholesterol/gamma-HCH transport system permease protein